MREVVAVEEHYRIGRRPARYSSRRYDWRMRAVGIMHMPQQTGQHARVSIAEIVIVILP